MAPPRLTQCPPSRSRIFSFFCLFRLLLALLVKKNLLRGKDPKKNVYQNRFWKIHPPPLAPPCPPSLSLPCSLFPPISGFLVSSVASLNPPPPNPPPSSYTLLSPISSGFLLSSIGRLSFVLRFSQFSLVLGLVLGVVLWRLPFVLRHNTYSHTHTHTHTHARTHAFHTHTHTHTIIHTYTFTHTAS